MKSNKNKYIISILVSLFISVIPAASVEWGGVIKNDSQAQLANFSDFSFIQSDGVYLWLNAPFGKSGLYFSGEGMYKYSLTIADGENAFTHFADLDLFKVGGDYELSKGSFSISLGRFMMTDCTAAVFSQNSDGLAVKYQGGKFGISAYAGYTGLLNALNVSMLDKDGYVFVSDGEIYSLANAFVPAMVTFEFPSLFANQALSLQCDAFLDLGEEKYNRFYGTLLLSGPISNKIFYNFASTFGTNSFSSLMNYTVFNFFIYPNEIMALSFGAEYASGKNAFFNPFLGVTSRSIVNSLSAPQTSGEILPNATVSFVFDKVFFGLTGKFLMGVPESSVEIKGAEADLSFICAPFTDLQIGFDVTSYFDLSKSNDSNLAATLKVAISF